MPSDRTLHNAGGTVRYDEIQRESHMFPGYGLRFGQGHAWPGPSFRKVNRNFIDYTEKVNIILLFAIITQVILFWQMYTVIIKDVLQG